MPKISEAQKEKRKELIIDSAFEVFAQKGYSEASMDDIVRHSGVSKGGIYTYFPTKESILLEIAERRFLARNELVKSLQAKKTAEEQIEGYIRWLLDALHKPEVIKRAKFSFEFWTILTRNPEKAHLALMRYHRFEADLEGLVQGGVDRGEFRADLKVKSAVLHLLSGLDGIGFMGTVMEVPISEEDIKEFVSLYLTHWRK